MVTKSESTSAALNRAHDPSKEYTGPLATRLEPILGYYLAEVGGGCPCYPPEDVKKRKLEVDRRMILLGQHFGIDENSETFWKELAHNLARKHVPGFQVRNPEAPANRKKDWTETRIGVLVFQMKREMKGKDGKSLPATLAAINLARRSPWKELLKNGTDKAASLRKYYQDNKKNSFAKQLETLVKHATEDGEMLFNDGALARIATEGFPVSHM